MQDGEEVQLPRPAWFGGHCGVHDVLVRSVVRFFDEDLVCCCVFTSVWFPLSYYFMRALLIFKHKAFFADDMNLSSHCCVVYMETRHIYVSSLGAGGVVILEFSSRK
jgi:hypothetical protein